MNTPVIDGVRLPINWSRLGLAPAWDAGGVVLHSGRRAWCWQPQAPLIEVRAAVPMAGPRMDGWGIDHIVLLVPRLDAAVSALAAIGVPVRRKDEIRGRQTAFFLVGTLLEVIESHSLDRPLLYGVALEVDDLDATGARLRTLGLEVTDPRPAVQEGRRISTIQGLPAGVVLMSRRT
ncbi:hypothetical protein HQ535_12975 [bacterium]|nr:hypothetical protein [bacterium]